MLTAFGREVTISATSRFTGKVRYSLLTDLDVVTTRAIVEVTTRHDSARKVAQLALLLGGVANPDGLAVLHFLPNVSPSSGSALALLVAGSSGVYNDCAALVAAVRAIP